MAGVGAGVDGVFMEVHERPEQARSDAQNALRLDLSGQAPDPWTRDALGGWLVRVGTDDRMYTSSWHAGAPWAPWTVVSGGCRWAAVTMSS